MNQEEPHVIRRSPTLLAIAESRYGALVKITGDANAVPEDPVTRVLGAIEVLFNRKMTPREQDDITYLAVTPEVTYWRDHDVCWIWPDELVKDIWIKYQLTRR